MSRKDVTELQKTNKLFQEFLEKEQNLIQEEIPLLLEFLQPFWELCETKEIHGEEALLIYEFNNNRPKSETLISPKSYLKRDTKEVVYKVYNQDAYLEYRPHAQIVDGFCVVPLEEFLCKVSLQDFVIFFENYLPIRLDKMNEQILNTKDSNEERAKFLENYKQSPKNN